MNVEFKSDFSDIGMVKKSISKVMTKGILPMFDNVTFRYTANDDVVMSGHSIEIRIKHDPRIQDQAILDGKVAMLAFRSMMMMRMDLSYLNNIDFSFIENKATFSKLELQKPSILKFLKDLFWDWFGCRMAVVDFPEEMFNFSYYSIMLTGDVYYLLRKPLYVYCFKGKDNYSFNYLKDIAIVEDFWFIYNLLGKATKKQEFISISEQLISELGKRL